ncbi:MATE family efflux transporter [Actinomyces trachealis]|uniref:MATE family efflux transporter n=1 Tax=Actinomyces trachealis TaxID=2763540 RepID=UPI001FD6152D|nr:MATE family efflux transporter [Actinomyces trachealis]
MPATPNPLNRRILSLALPALGALVAEPLFVLIDSAMVGHLGAESLAGLSLASTILTTVVGLFVFLAYATTATTARLFGAGERRAGLRAGVDGLWLAALLGLFAGVLLATTAPLVVSALGGRGAVATAAVAYLRASAAGVPGMLVVFAATGALRGLLDTRTPFVVATAGAVANVLLNATFLYGLHLGIAGSGLGTALAQTGMGVALTLPLAKAARTEGVVLRPSGTGLGSSLGAGTPLLVRNISLRVAILATVWAATSLGQAPLAAHQVVNTIWGLAAFSMDALAIAAQALVGTALGEASADAKPTDALLDKAEPNDTVLPQRLGVSVDAVLHRCLAWGVGTGMVIGMLVAATSPWLPLLFTTDASVSAAARPALLVAAAAMPLAGAVFLFDGVLMGAGDGRYLACAGVATLVPYLPAAYAVAHGWPAGDGAGLLWLWGAFAWLFMGARAVTTGLRARSEAWRH